MQLNVTTKTKIKFPTIQPDMLDRLAQQAETLATKPAPQPKPVIKRWPRLLVW